VSRDQRIDQSATSFEACLTQAGRSNLFDDVTHYFGPLDFTWLFLMTNCTDFELHCFFPGPKIRVSQGITAYVKYQFQVSMVGINTNSVKARLWVPEVF